MKTRYSWKEGIRVSGVVGIVALLVLLAIPTGNVAQSEWVQTTQADFDGATEKLNVDTTGDPGNVALIPSPTDWIKYENNPVMSPGSPGAWDDYSVASPTILKDGSVYKMWFEAVSSATLWHFQIGYAESSDGLIWSKRATPVFGPDPGSSWEDYGVDRPVVLKIGDVYKMWYVGFADSTGYANRVGHAESSNGIDWVRPSPTPVLGPGSPGGWDDTSIWGIHAIFDNGIYHMWYTGNDGVNCRASIGYANSTDGLSWTRYPNPVLAPGSPGSWDDLGIEVSHVEKIGEEYIMWYNRHCPTQAVGVATSTDGLSWTKHANNPVLEKGSTGQWDEAGVTWVAVLRDGSSLKMWYSGETGLGNWRMHIGHATATYGSMGTLVSSVFDAGAGVSHWNTLSWEGTLPANTQISLSFRTSEDNITWSDWSIEHTVSPVDLSALSRSTRYFQYRATLDSLDSMSTPILSEVKVSYEQNTATPPTLISPQDGSWTSDTTPDFSWQFGDTEGDSQIAFALDIDDNSSFATIDFASGEVLSSEQNWTSSPSIADGIWYWRVRTQDSFGMWSNNSTDWSFEVDTPPSHPTGLAVEPGERGELKLTWNQNPEDDVSGYNVFRADVSGGPYEMINEDLVPNPNYNDTRIPDNTVFYYVVTAVDLREQESDYSHEASGTTFEVQEEDWLEEYWWIVLLIALGIIIAIIILARRRKPEEEEEPAQEAAEEEVMDLETERAEMTDDERLEKLERRHKEGHISEETYIELKERYGKNES